jgi:hypothetical protein
MRKSLIDTTAPADTQPSTGKGSWLDLEAIATVEITSEDPHFPIEHALGTARTSGWRAEAKGPQFIRLNFDQPTAIHRIHLHFSDLAAERSQEFAIYARGEGQDLKEVRRQQFTFSPGGSSEEIEDYTVNLPAVTTLELRIDPDRSHDPTHSQHYAVLKSLRLA